MTFLQKMKSVAIKGFVGGEWKVAYRIHHGANSQYHVVDAPKDTCIADPFLYEINDEHYLFVELFDKKKNKACIAYYKFAAGIPKYHGIVIDEPYHMSYPCVFEYNGEHYMIPETSANLSIDLYKATSFPDKWEKVSCLLSGVRYVDTTILKQCNAYYAVSYRKEDQRWYLDTFALDMEKQSLKRIASKSYAKNVGRPAGNFYLGEALMRPAQNCSHKYGENIILYQVNEIDDGKYSECETARMELDSIPMNEKPNRIHTYNYDSIYECVDLYFEKQDLLHGVKTLWHAYLRKYFKGI